MTHENENPDAGATASGAVGEESNNARQHNKAPAPEQPTRPRTSNHPEGDRLREAYKKMADEARYRPQAPGDSWGLVLLTPKQLRDHTRLEREAAEYAEKFIAEEDTLSFWIGYSNLSTNRALVWTIEAARCLCGGGDRVALKLLEMAVEEVRQVRRERKRGRS